MSFRKTISWCLFPITIWYAIGVGIRNMLFSIGLRKQHVTPITSIGVGNLAMGGTGKTPHVEYLIRLLENDCSIALLSRGYRRKSKGFVIADEENRHTETLGDEAAMMARKFPNVITSVCENRNEGLRRLSQLENPPQLVILDDVFQHQQTKPTVNILLTEYDRPYFEDRILPFGDLREDRHGHNRANIIIVTKSPEQLNPIKKHNITNALQVQPYQKVFFSYLRYGIPTALKDGSRMHLSELQSVVIMTGIANPQPMVKHVEKNCRKNCHLRYGDHHSFTASDIAEMQKRLNEMPGERKIILTTEKDAARLRDSKHSEAIAHLPIYYLPIEVAFHDNKEYNFDSTIRSIVKENISFLGKLKTNYSSFL